MSNERIRRTNQCREECLNIGLQIIIDYNYRIGKKQFREMYRDALESRGIQMPSDERQLKQDMKKIEERLLKNEKREILWKDFNVDKPTAQSPFSKLGKLVSENIRRVYLTAGSREYLLYDSDGKSEKQYKTLSSFKKKLKELYTFRKKKKSDSIQEESERDDEQTEEIGNKAIQQGSINNNTLIHIYIIFIEKGDEKTTTDYFDINEPLKVLFTDSKNRCAEIVSRLWYLPSITTDVYYTIFP